MDGRDRTAHAPKRRLNRLASPRLNTPLDVCALVIAAAGIHVIVSISLALACPWRIDPANETKPAWVRMTAHAEYLEESWDHVEEVYEVDSSLIVSHDRVIADDAAPLLGEGPIVGLEGEPEYLPFEESLGDDGLSDVSFRGPANNGMIGLGGSAGGTFGGRGGSRDLISGSGGWRSRHDGTWRRSDLVPHSSRVKVGEQEELKLEGMHVSVQVEGFRARVLLDFLYRNDQDRDLEGRFQVRLPNEASPYYFAFGETVREVPLATATPQGEFPATLAAIRNARRGTWTEPKEARMVPRARAARAYEDVARRRIDPALLEWAGPDIFSARVSPLAAGELHRIVLGYEVNLTSERCALAYTLELPRVIPNLAVDLEVTNSRATVAPPGPLQNGWFRYRDPPERRFTVRVPNRGAVMLRGRDPDAGDFFAVRFQPRLPVERAAATPRAVFLVDTSASSNPVGFNVWLSLLEAILERNRSTLREFAVAFFDVDVGWWRRGFVPNSAANVKTLMNDASRCVLEGATDLRAALHAGSALPGAYDLFLLSDGTATWGSDDEHAMRRALGEAHALFAYQTALSGTDSARLRRLARATGGAVFSVASEAQVAGAATAHTMRPWHVDGVSMPGAHDVLLDGRPRVLYPGQRLLLVGRGRPEGGLHVTLAVHRGSERRRVATAVRTVYESRLAPRVYGQVAVGQLEMVDAVPADVARAYATHFRVVGKTCSLLMLETEADYQRFGITQKDDASLVRAHAADVTVRTALDTVRDLSPKARFLGLLRSVREAVDTDVTLPAGLDALLAEVPGEAFDIRATPLGRGSLAAAPGARAYLAELAKDDLDYEVVWRHAVDRSRAGDPASALRALSSLIEKSPGRPALLRDVGFQAQAWGYGGHAYHLLRRAAVLRPHQVQGLADVAASLAASERADAAILWYESALARTTDARSESVRRCTLFAYAHLLDGIVRGTREARFAEYAAERLASLRHELGTTSADLVVTIGWSTDRTDVDLHVVEPSGEECYYKNTVTKIGGRITRDVTTGFGPETYVLQDAPEGTYGVSVKYYSADALRTSTRTRVWVTVYRNWGRDEVTTSRTSLLLETAKETQPVTMIAVAH